jgi:hypothetical protein
MSLVKTVKAGEIYLIAINHCKEQGERASTYQIPIWLRRLASAEVAQSPSGIPKHAELVILAEESK